MVASFTITAHAAARWIERVDPACNIPQARAAIRTHLRAIDAALSIGCKCIRLGGGQRIIVDFKARQVVTILPAQPRINSVQHSGRALHFSASKRQARFGECD